MKLVLRPHSSLVINAELVVIEGGCLECSDDLAREAPFPKSVEHRFRCRCLDCLTEFGGTRMKSGVGIRRPYGCRRWIDVDSSYVHAVGYLDYRWLLVRFRNGGVYRYDCGDSAITAFEGLTSAPSTGRYLVRAIKSRWPAELLCARYGCVRPVDRERNQILCRHHLRRDV